MVCTVHDEQCTPFLESVLLNVSRTCKANQKSDLEPQKQAMDRETIEYIQGDGLAVDISVQCHTILGKQPSECQQHMQSQPKLRFRTSKADDGQRNNGVQTKEMI